MRGVSGKVEFGLRTRNHTNNDETKKYLVWCPATLEEFSGLRNLVLVAVEVRLGWSMARLTVVRNLFGASPVSLLVWLNVERTTPNTRHFSLSFCPVTGLPWLSPYGLFRLVLALGSNVLSIRRC